MIWGGDDTIKSIRNLQTKPRCVDVCFSDRYSVCVLDGKKILEAADEQHDSDVGTAAPLVILHTAVPAFQEADILFLYSVDTFDN